MKLISILVCTFVILVPLCSFADNVEPLNAQSPEDILVDNIVVDCSKQPNVNCVSKNAFRYLEEKFNSSENWDVTDTLKFDKNERTDDLPEVNSQRKGRGMEEITDVIYERGVRFLASHDLKWRLPEMFFGGVEVKISAPSSAESRTLFNVELLTPEGDDAEEKSDETTSSAVSDTNVGEPRGEQGRLFHKKFGKLKKKLLLGFFALLLIIKLIKIKLFFLLPLILGVGTVKKLAIKFLFFIFPALAALFKSCHHHHHHVPVKQYHLHTVKHTHPHHYDEYSHGGGGGGGGGGSGGPPDWLRRNEYVGDTTASALWETQPYYPEESYQPRSTTEASSFSPSSYASYNTIEHQKAQAAQQAYRNQLRNQAAEVNKRYQSSQIPSLVVPYKVGQLTYASPLHPGQSQYPENAAAAIPVSSESYDPYFSPKLKAIDSVFIKMGFNDEGCRERLVCSMYKTPTRFSPNSNLVSAELSVDPSELRTPKTATTDVQRFFTYIQAAKDGQDQKDCLSLYQQCSINTEP
ncbi:hypothetical protein B566_EDAN008486 [Ephemera danica]|nr:hypothetical protein B566_EDAN008486 [Ephemera danica]